MIPPSYLHLIPPSPLQWGDTLALPYLGEKKAALNIGLGHIVPPVLSLGEDIPSLLGLTFLPQSLILGHETQAHHLGACSIDL